MMNINNIINIIKSSEKIAIIAHINPDGDAVGSSLGYAIALRNLGKKVDIYLQDGVPNIYRFLHASADVLTGWNGEKYDVAVALDSGDIERLGSCIDVYNNAGIRINIDHHITNTNFGDYNHIESNASSTGEIIYRVIKMSSMDLNREIAECLYVAIATDTGGFRYSNTSSICMQVAADLINYNIDVSDICRRVFDVTSITKVKLMGAAIESLEIHQDGKMALMSISNIQINQLKANPDEFDGIINIARNIEGIEAAALLVEREPGLIKVNLRSNAYVDVAKIAKAHNGGGHKRAAGCTFENTAIDQVKHIIFNDMLQELKVQ